MSTKMRLLEHLKRHRNQWVSGEYISNRLGISRTAIWKQIKGLKTAGHQIESAPKKGYRLTREADLLAADLILENLQTGVMGQPAMHVYKETDSTNTQAKILAGQGAAEGTVVVADTQTHGRGRRGRTWFSPPGRSIYASFILRPPLAPFQAPQITLMTAVAVATTLNRYAGLEVNIKWPNDLLLKGKKIAGILTEISTEMEVVDYVVVGLGINVNTLKAEIPHEIADIATSMRIECGSRTVRSGLVRRLLEDFEDYYERLKAGGFGPIMAQWRSMSDIIGQKVHVDILKSRLTGTVENVDDDGVLILKDEHGEIHRIYSGDVTRLRPDAES